MLSSVTQSWSQGSLPAPGVTVEVILAAVCFTVEPGLVGLVATYPGQPAALALVAGWPILALAAASSSTNGPAPPRGG